MQVQQQLCACGEESEKVKFLNSTKAAIGKQRPQRIEIVSMN